MRYPRHHRTPSIRVTKPLNAILLVFCLPLVTLAEDTSKVYIAVEGEGALAVFDAASRQLLKRIDLADDSQGIHREMTAHNVQVSPDGSSVWVTANAGHQEHGNPAADEGHGDMDHTQIKSPADELIVIDPQKDEVRRRITLAPGLHLAHVVVSPDGSRAYVTAQNAGLIYEVDASTYLILRTITAPPNSQPHGLRLSPDGNTAYIALLTGKSLGILDIPSGQLREIPLGGAPVQTAVTADGHFVMASLFDTRRIALYDTIQKTVRHIDLLGGAKGPVQIYPTPDNRYLYVADQGHYFGQPDSDWVYKVDLKQLKTIWSIKAGKAPHGMVVDHEGHYAYVTNLVSGDLSIIDLASDREVARIAIGTGPNGVSVWSSRFGGKP